MSCSLTPQFLPLLVQRRQQMALGGEALLPTRRKSAADSPSTRSASRATIVPMASPILSPFLAKAAV